MNIIKQLREREGWYDIDRKKGMIAVEMEALYALLDVVEAADNLVNGFMTPHDDRCEYWIDVQDKINRLEDK